MSAEGITRVKRRGAVILDNNTVYDDSISYTALGVLAVLLARPDDAPKGYRTLKRPGVGQASILSAFRELRQAGYRYQFLRTGKNDQGKAKVYTDTYIYESPVSLEMAKQDHFATTGHVAIDMPDKRKAKETPASETAQPDVEGARLCDAHKGGAHSCDAHDRCAQTPGSASVGFSGSPNTVEQINQGPANEKAQDQELPAQPGAAAGDDATPKAPLTLTPEQMERNKRGAAAARAALRGQHAPDVAGSPADGIKEVASLRHEQERVA